MHRMQYYGLTGRTFFTYSVCFRDGLAHIKSLDPGFLKMPAETINIPDGSTDVRMRRVQEELDKWPMHEGLHGEWLAATRVPANQAAENRLRAAE